MLSQKFNYIFILLEENSKIKFNEGFSARKEIFESQKERRFNSIYNKDGGQNENAQEQPMF